MYHGRWDGPGICGTVWSLVRSTIGFGLSVFRRVEDDRMEKHFEKRFLLELHLLPLGLSKHLKNRILLRVLLGFDPLSDPFL